MSELQDIWGRVRTRLKQQRHMPVSGLRVYRGDRALERLAVLGRSGQVRILTDRAKEWVATFGQRLGVRPIRERGVLSEPEFIVDVEQDKQTGELVVYELDRSALGDERQVRQLQRQYPHVVYEVAKTLNRPEWGGMRAFLRAMAKGVVPAVGAQVAVNTLLNLVTGGLGGTARAVTQGVETAAKVKRVWDMVRAGSVIQRLVGVTAGALAQEAVQRLEAGAAEKRSYAPALWSVLPDVASELIVPRLTNVIERGFFQFRAMYPHRALRFAAEHVLPTLGSAAAFEYAAAREEGRQPSFRDVLVQSAWMSSLPLAWAGARHVAKRVLRNAAVEEARTAARVPLERPIPAPPEQAFPHMPKPPTPSEATPSEATATAAAQAAQAPAQAPMGTTAVPRISGGEQYVVIRRVNVEKYIQPETLGQVAPVAEHAVVLGGVAVNNPRAVRKFYEADLAWWDNLWNTLNERLKLKHPNMAQRAQFYKLALMGALYKQAREDADAFIQLMHKGGGKVAMTHDPAELIHAFAADKAAQLHRALTRDSALGATLEERMANAQLLDELHAFEQRHGEALENLLSLMHTYLAPGKGDELPPELLADYAKFVDLASTIFKEKLFDAPYDPDVHPHVNLWDAHVKRTARETGDVVRRHVLMPLMQQNVRRLIRPVRGITEGKPVFIGTVDFGAAVKGARGKGVKLGDVWTLLPDADRDVVVKELNEFLARLEERLFEHDPTALQVLRDNPDVRGLFWRDVLTNDALLTKTARKTFKQPLMDVITTFVWSRIADRLRHRMPKDAEGFWVSKSGVAKLEPERGVIFAFGEDTSLSAVHKVLGKDELPTWVPLPDADDARPASDKEHADTIEEMKQKVDEALSKAEQAEQAAEQAAAQAQAPAGKKAPQRPPKVTLKRSREWRNRIDRAMAQYTKSVAAAKGKSKSAQERQRRQAAKQLIQDLTAVIRDMQDKEADNELVRPVKQLRQQLIRYFGSRGYLKPSDYDPYAPFLSPFLDASAQTWERVDVRRMIPQLPRSKSVQQAKKRVEVYTLNVSHKPVRNTPETLNVDNLVAQWFNPQKPVGSYTKVLWDALSAVFTHDLVSRPDIHLVRDANAAATMLAEGLERYGRSAAVVPKQLSAQVLERLYRTKGARKTNHERLFIVPLTNDVDLILGAHIATGVDNEAAFKAVNVVVDMLSGRGSPDIVTLGSALAELRKWGFSVGDALPRALELLQLAAARARATELGSGFAAGSVFNALNKAHEVLSGLYAVVRPHIPEGVTGDPSTQRLLFRPHDPAFKRPADPLFISLLLLDPEIAHRQLQSVFGTTAQAAAPALRPELVAMTQLVEPELLGLPGFTPEQLEAMQAGRPPMMEAETRIAGIGGEAAPSEATAQAEAAPELPAAPAPQRGLSGDVLQSLAAPVLQRLGIQVKSLSREILRQENPKAMAKYNHNERTIYVTDESGAWGLLHEIGEAMLDHLSPDERNAVLLMLARKLGQASGGEIDLNIGLPGHRARLRDEFADDFAAAVVGQQPLHPEVLERVHDRLPDFFTAAHEVYSRIRQARQATQAAEAEVQPVTARQPIPKSEQVDEGRAALEPTTSEPDISDVKAATSAGVVAQASDVKAAAPDKVRETAKRKRKAPLVSEGASKVVATEKTAPAVPSAPVKPDDAVALSHVELAARLMKEGKFAEAAKLVANMSEEDFDAVLADLDYDTKLRWSDYLFNNPDALADRTVDEAMQLMQAPSEATPSAATEPQKPVVAQSAKPSAKSKSKRRKMAEIFNMDDDHVGHFVIRSNVKGQLTDDIVNPVIVKYVGAEELPGEAQRRNVVDALMAAYDRMKEHPVGRFVHGLVPRHVVQAIIEKNVVDKLPMVRTLARNTGVLDDTSFALQIQWFSPELGGQLRELHNRGASPEEAIKTAETLTVVPAALVQSRDGLAMGMEINLGDLILGAYYHLSRVDDKTRADILAGNSHRLNVVAHEVMHQLVTNALARSLRKLGNTEAGKRWLQLKAAAAIENWIDELVGDRMRTLEQRIANVEYALQRAKEQKLSQSHIDHLEQTLRQLKREAEERRAALREEYREKILATYPDASEHFEEWLIHSMLKNEYHWLNLALNPENASLLRQLYVYAKILANYAWDSALLVMHKVFGKRFNLPDEIDIQFRRNLMSEIWAFHNRAWDARLREKVRNFITPMTQRVKSADIHVNVANAKDAQHTLEALLKQFPEHDRLAITEYTGELLKFYQSEVGAQRVNHKTLEHLLKLSHYLYLNQISPALFLRNAELIAKSHRGQLVKWLVEAKQRELGRALTEDERAAIRAEVDAAKGNVPQLITMMIESNAALWDAFFEHFKQEFKGSETTVIHTPYGRAENQPSVVLQSRADYAERLSKLGKETLMLEHNINDVFDPDVAEYNRTFWSAVFSSLGLTPPAKLTELYRLNDTLAQRGKQNDAKLFGHFTYPRGMDKIPIFAPTVRDASGDMIPLRRHSSAPKLLDNAVGWLHLAHSLGHLDEPTLTRFVINLGRWLIDVHKVKFINGDEAAIDHIAFNPTAKVNIGAQSYGLPEYIWDTMFRPMFKTVSDLFGNTEALSLLSTLQSALSVTLTEARGKRVIKSLGEFLSDLAKDPTLVSKVYEITVNPEHMGDVRAALRKFTGRYVQASLMDMMTFLHDVLVSKDTDVHPSLRQAYGQFRNALKEIYGANPQLERIWGGSFPAEAMAVMMDVIGDNLEHDWRFRETLKTVDDILNANPSMRLKIGSGITGIKEDTVNLFAPDVADFKYWTESLYRTAFMRVHPHETNPHAIPAYVPLSARMTNKGALDTVLSVQAALASRKSSDVLYSGVLPNQEAIDTMRNYVTTAVKLMKSAFPDLWKALVGDANVHMTPEEWIKDNPDMALVRLGATLFSAPDATAFHNVYMDIAAQVEALKKTPEGKVLAEAFQSLDKALTDIANFWLRRSALSEKHASFVIWRDMYPHMSNFKEFVDWHIMASGGHARIDTPQADAIWQGMVNSLAAPIPMKYITGGEKTRYNSIFRLAKFVAADLMASGEVPHKVMDWTRKYLLTDPTHIRPTDAEMYEGLRRAASYLRRIFKLNYMTEGVADTPLNDGHAVASALMSLTKSLQDSRFLDPSSDSPYGRAMEIPEGFWELVKKRVVTAGGYDVKLTDPNVMRALLIAYLQDAASHYETRWVTTPTGQRIKQRVRVKGTPDPSHLTIYDLAGFAAVLSTGVEPQTTNSVWSAYSGKHHLPDTMGMRMALLILNNLLGHGEYTPMGGMTTKAHAVKRKPVIYYDAATKTFTTVKPTQAEPMHHDVVLTLGGLIDYYIHQMHREILPEHATGIRTTSLDAMAEALWAQERRAEASEVWSYRGIDEDALVDVQTIDVGEHAEEVGMGEMLAASDDAASHLDTLTSKPAAADLETAFSLQEDVPTDIIAFRPQGDVRESMRASMHLPAAMDATETGRQVYYDNGARLITALELIAQNPDSLSPEELTASLRAIAHQLAETLQLGRVDRQTPADALALVQQYVYTLSLPYRMARQTAEDRNMLQSIVQGAVALDDDVVEALAGMARRFVGSAYHIKDSVNVPDKAFTNLVKLITVAMDTNASPSERGDAVIKLARALHRDPQFATLIESMKKTLDTYKSEGLLGLIHTTRDLYQSYTNIYPLFVRAVHKLSTAEAKTVYDTLTTRLRLSSDNFGHGAVILVGSEQADKYFGRGYIDDVLMPTIHAGRRYVRDFELAQTSFMDITDRIVNAATNLLIPGSHIVAPEQADVLQVLTSQLRGTLQTVEALHNALSEFAAHLYKHGNVVIFRTDERGNSIRLSIPDTLGNIMGTYAVAAQKFATQAEQKLPVVMDAIQQVREAVTTLSQELQRAMSQGDNDTAQAVQSKLQLLQRELALLDTTHQALLQQRDTARRAQILSMAVTDEAILSDGMDVVNRKRFVDWLPGKEVAEELLGDAVEFVKNTKKDDTWRSLLAKGRQYIGNIHGMLSAFGRSGKLLSDTLNVVNTMTAIKRSRTFLPLAELKAFTEEHVRELRSKGYNDDEIHLVHQLAALITAGYTKVGDDPLRDARTALERTLEEMTEFKKSGGHQNSPLRGLWESDAPIQMVRSFMNWLDWMDRVVARDPRYWDEAERYAGRIRRVLDDIWSEMDRLGIPFVGRERIAYEKGYFPFTPNAVGRMILAAAVEAKQAVRGKQEPALADAFGEMFAALATGRQVSAYETVARHRRHLHPMLLFMASEQDPLQNLSVYLHHIGNYAGEYIALYQTSKAVAADPVFSKYLPTVTKFITEAEQRQEKPTTEELYNAWIADISSEAAELQLGTEVGDAVAQAIRMLHGDFYPTLAVDIASIPGFQSTINLVKQYSDWVTKLVAGNAPLGQSPLATTQFQPYGFLRGIKTVPGKASWRDKIAATTSSIFYGLPIAAFWSERTALVDLFEGMTSALFGGTSAKEIWQAVTHQLNAYPIALQKLVNATGGRPLQEYFKANFKGAFNAETVKALVHDPLFAGLMARFIDAFYTWARNIPGYERLPDIILHGNLFNAAEMVTLTKSGVERAAFFERELEPLVRKIVRGEPLSNDEQIRATQIAAAHRLPSLNALVETARMSVSGRTDIPMTPDAIVDEVKRMFVTRSVMERHHEYSALDMPLAWHAQPWMRTFIYMIKSWGFQQMHKLWWHYFGRPGEIFRRLLDNPNLTADDIAKAKRDILRNHILGVAASMGVMIALTQAFKFVYDLLAGRHTEPSLIEPDGSPSLSGALQLVTDTIWKPPGMFGIVSDVIFGAMRDMKYGKDASTIAGMFLSPIASYWFNFLMAATKGIQSGWYALHYRDEDAEQAKAQFVQLMSQQIPVVARRGQVLRALRWGETQVRWDLLHNFYPVTQQWVGERAKEQTYWRTTINHVLPLLKTQDPHKIYNTLMKVDPEVLYRILTTGGSATPTELNTILAHLQSYYAAVDPAKARELADMRSMLNYILKTNAQPNVKGRLEPLAALVTKEIVQFVDKMPQKDKAAFLLHLATGAVNYATDPSVMFELPVDVHALTIEVYDRRTSRAKPLQLVAKVSFLNRLAEELAASTGMSLEEARQFVLQLRDRAKAVEAVRSLMRYYQHIGGPNAFSEAWHRAYAGALYDTYMAAGAMFPELVSQEAHAINQQWASRFNEEVNRLYRMGVPEKEAVRTALINIVTSPEYRMMVEQYTQHMGFGRRYLYNFLSGELPTDHVTALATHAEATLQHYWSWLRKTQRKQLGEANITEYLPTDVLGGEPVQSSPVERRGATPNLQPPLIR